MTQQYSQPADSPQEAPNLTIERGGRRLVLEKLPELMAVKKKPRAQRGVLRAPSGDAEALRSVAFQEALSTPAVEVYRVPAQELDATMEMMRAQSQDVEWVAHVYRVQGDTAGLMVPRDSIYVELRDGADTAAVQLLLDEHGLEITPAPSGAANAFILRLTRASSQNPIKIANALHHSGQVTLAEPDFAFKVSLKIYRPQDPLFVQQWHLENLGGLGLTAGADVAATQAWDITRGDRTIVVCVIDDGVQVDHPEFASTGKIVAPFDFGGNDADPSPGSNTDNHGTACAGVAVADENGVGVVGAAPNCRLMPVRMSQWITDDAIEQQFEYARDHGADVISCSWGVDANVFALSTRMHNAIRSAARDGRNGRGCVVLFAAGNDDRPVNGSKDGVQYLDGFAAHPDVITVAASNSHDVRSNYSNYGAEISVCAPSSGSGGRRIVTTDRTGTAGYQAGDYTTVQGFGGTSSATPLVAGIAALILSVHPELTSTQVQEILEQTAERIDAVNGAYNPAGHSDLYGHGRVHAFRAVQEAQRRRGPTEVRRISFDRMPNLPIPDARPTGVSDAMQVDETAIVRSVAVSVDIAHTYRGDLRLDLVGPDGTAVTLQQFLGGSQDNLVRTFSVADTPGLGAFAGRSARGPWALVVSDHVAVDIGTLRRWSLTLEVVAGPRTYWETAPGLIIPDNNATGITSNLAVDGQGRLRDIALTVDINHSWRGDLIVTLFAPNGASAVVHNLAGGQADDIRRTFVPGDTLALQQLRNAGIEIQGTWKLRVADRAVGDVGKLNTWGLRLMTA
jgi:subtilisin-like proprotein convertase family protein